MADPASRSQELPRVCASVLGPVEAPGQLLLVLLVRVLVLIVAELLGQETANLSAMVDFYKPQGAEDYYLSY